MHSTQTDPKVTITSRDIRSNPRPEATAQSRDLLRDAREVLIQHGTQLYQLRHTRACKLILVK